ncbi:TIGR03564 family F420-dependent LLM class oxidoreductase [Pseudonocardia sp. RS11V-5]|uniref:TIGR03564 family F420-dependent LLM class oxidoreductase n=1 Tax=Pseudonocardia terrae TaxID=2905831 RepID=UPI001E6344E4|nr:TIGR03564 family F420-dependent LLM class oxidoreductase [Pseudonocardia terrae]MCE3553513.1 TIGR03564 family F420-dependent LLM class oxidoreductase [Pseudonocardia terrae]
MRTSLIRFLNDSEGTSPVDTYVRDVAAAHDSGFHRIWTVQLPWDPDVVVTLAVALREVPGIRLASGVLPIQGRHPMVMAQEALTLSSFAEGRFALGIGVTHALVSEGMWGIPWNRHVSRMEEYLNSLLPLLEGREAAVEGETVTCRGTISVPGATPPEVFLAALGPRMLDIAGRRTAGTLTWMVGPRTLRNHVVPTLRRAAEGAARTADVAAAYPVCVTDDPVKARELAVELYALYGTLPSYRAMLDREGLDEPADIAIIGDEDHVGRRLSELADLGVAEFTAHIFGPSREDRDRTWATLREAAQA